MIDYICTMRFSKAEREVLKTYDKRTKTLVKPEGLTDQQLAAALYSLEEKHILTARHPLPDKWEISITDHGRMYIEGNPGLKNPFPWDIILRWVALATLAVAVAALLVGCIRLITTS